MSHSKFEICNRFVGIMSAGGVLRYVKVHYYTIRIISSVTIKIKWLYSFFFFFPPDPTRLNPPGPAHVRRTLPYAKNVHFLLSIMVNASGNLIRGLTYKLQFLKSAQIRARNNNLIGTRVLPVRKRAKCFQESTCGRLLSPPAGV